MTPTFGAPTTPVTLGEVLRLAGPAAASSLLMHAFRPVDQLFAAYIGPDAQGALGTASFVVIAVYGLFMAISAGVAPLVGRAAGASDATEVRRVLDHAFGACVVLAGVVATGALVLSHRLPVWLGLDAGEARELAEYLQVLFVLGAPLVVHPTLDAALNTLGHTRASMWVQAIAVAANTLLSAIFVLGFGWGVRGAALGTVAGTGLAVIVGLAGLGRLVGPLRPRFSLAATAEIVRVGTPIGLSVLFYAVVYFALIRVAVAPLGLTQGLAIGFSALESVTWPVYLGLSIAASSVVARRLGAGQPEEARRAVGYALWPAVAFGFVVMAAFALAGEVLVRPFAADPGALAQGLLYATIIGWSQPFVAAEAVYEGVLGGAGDTRTVAVIAIPGNLLRVPLAWWLAFPLGFGAAGVWWAIGASSILKATLKGVMVYRGGWATRAL